VTAQEKLQIYFDTIVHDLQVQLSVPLTTTILTIAEKRRLLALRGYLRYPTKRGKMSDNWAWTKEKEDAFVSGTKGVEFRAEVEKVKKEFRRLMPGYFLTGEVKARSLERQVKLWNKNETVKNLSHALNRKALKEIARTQKLDRHATTTTAVYADEPAADDLERFRTWLAGDGLVGSTTNATPGLSDHGQAKAVDFTVYKNPEEKDDKAGKAAGQKAEKPTKVAEQSSTDMKEKWDDPGFTAALTKAARGTRLTGPLKVPPEAWHWTFTDAD
jgi:hypothetical protein